MTPASPAPLMPNGFSGDGVSRWSISMRARHLGRVRHQEVHERGVEQLARLVVLHPLVERAADALGDAAVDLALDDHRVDQPCRSRAPRSTAGSGSRRCPGRSPRPPRACRWRRSTARASSSRCPPAPAPRRRAPAACWPCRPRTGWPPGRPRRTRTAAGWTARRRCPAASRLAGAPLTRTTPSTISRSSSATSSASAAIRSALARTIRGGEGDGGAAHHRGARGERADGVGEPAGVPGDDLDVRQRHPELVGDDLREHRLVPLALGGQAGRHLDLPAGLDHDVGALVGPDAGALDVAGQAEADRAALGPRSRSR